MFRVYGGGKEIRTPGALPTELYPQKWWTFRDSNPGPTGYEPVALTNWAKDPYYLATTYSPTQSPVQYHRPQ